VVVPNIELSNFHLVFSFFFHFSVLFWAVPTNHHPRSYRQSQILQPLNWDSKLQETLWWKYTTIRFISAGTE